MLRNVTNRVIPGGMDTPLTVAGLIETLTPAVLAGALGVSVQAISNMKQRNAIPPKHWPGVVSVAKQYPSLKKFTYEELVRMHTPAPRVAQRESGRRNHPRQAVG